MKTNFAVTLAVAFTLLASALAQADTRGICKTTPLLEDPFKSASPLTDVFEQELAAGALRQFLQTRTTGDQILLEWYKTHGQYGVGVEAAMRDHLKPIADRFNASYCNLGDTPLASQFGHAQCVNGNGIIYDANVRSITLKADRYNKNGPSIIIEACIGAEKPLCISIDLLDNVDDYAELERGRADNLKRINARNAAMRSCLFIRTIENAPIKAINTSPSKASEGMVTSTGSRTQAE